MADAFFEYDHSDHISSLLVELDQWRSRLDLKGPLPRTWAGRLRRDLEALRALLQRQIDRDEGNDLPSEKPPHY